MLTSNLSSSQSLQMPQDGFLPRQLKASKMLKVRGRICLSVISKRAMPRMSVSIFGIELFVCVFQVFLFSVDLKSRSQNRSGWHLVKDEESHSKSDFIVVRRAKTLRN